jgi:hypothetical protein
MSWTALVYTVWPRPGKMIFVTGFVTESARTGQGAGKVAVSALNCGDTQPEVGMRARPLW